MKYFKFKFLMVLLALAAAIPPAWAQQEVTVCDGTATTQYLPVYGYYFDWSQHNQMIYPASELADLPAGSFIYSVTFYPDNAISFSGAAVTFSMANMAEGTAAFPLNNYGNADGPIDVALTQVASVMPTSVNPWTITFDDPFEYTGGDLIIDVVTNEGTDSRIYFSGKDVGANYGYYSYGSYAKYLITTLPKATFAYEGEAKPYVGRVAPKSIDFGKLLPNEQKTENITLSNKGANAFTPILSGMEGTPFSTTYTPSAIAPGAEVTIPITYNPTAVGNHDATLSITANETSDIDLTVTLAGRCSNDITVEDGDVSQSYLPLYYPGYYTQKNQMIYPASDLTSLVGKQITGLTFYCNDALVFDGTYSVALGMTNQASYSGATPIEGLTTVATNHTATAGVAEFAIAFDEPFTYTGDNLVIQMEVTDKGTTGYAASPFYGTNQSSNTAYYWYNASYGDYGYTRAFLPKVTFDYVTGETPVVTVDAPVFDPEDGATFEENLTVSLSCATTGATIQYSYNGEYFIDYDAPIVIDETTTIYAKAVLGTVESETVSATYTKEAAPQPATNEFILLTDASKLEASKRIIFVNKENNKAMSSTQNGNNRSATDITISTSNVTTATEATEIFTLEKDGDYWLFKATKTPGYIYAAGANSNNYLRTEEEADNRAKATVTIAEDGKATVQFNAGTRNTLLYNNSNDIFSCYAASGNQQPVYIFIENTGDTPEPPVQQVKTPTFDPAEGEYTEAQTVTIACETEGATIHYTVDGTEPTAQSAVYGEPIAVGETTTIKAIAVKEGMTDSEIAEATYTINIPQPGEEKIYVKLTTPELTPGKKYIFVYEGSQAMAMGAFNSSSTKCNPVDVTINNNEVNIAGKDDIIEFTAGEGPAVYGSDTKQYTLALPSGQYLAYKSNTDFKLLNAVGNYDTEGLWRIKTHDTGYTVNNASSASRSIQKHSSTNMFGPYADGQDVVAIYVEKSDEPVEPEQVATPTFDPAEGEYTEAQTVTITCETEGAAIHYTVDGTEPTAESPVYNEAIAVGQTMTIKAIAMKEGMTDSEIAEVTYTIVPAEPVATPTLSLVSGSYTGVQTLIIGCETADAVISYSTDSGETWTQGDTVTVDHDMNIIVKAEKDGMAASTVTAYYIIDIPVELPTIEPFKGYYSIKNNGNGKYANIAGRKTLNFTDATADKAGTVIYLETNDKGQVQSLRSQAADLQGYADRAMKYVPEIVQLIADKLHAEGDGNILGDEGLDAIMQKFNESFDHHLYVEEAQGGYRLYGKTPSMQPVVDFYRENTHQVETKLPMLEDFINSAIAKVLEKTGGKGQSILKPFSLHETWQRMGGTLTEPVDEASTMTFYREVLNNKNYVWDFAYETAMTYWERLKNNQTFIDAMSELGEYAQYIEMIEQVRPDFKYYVVQKDDKPDFISEGNKDINDGRAIWTLEPRTDFTVNFPAANVKDNEFYTTLYTDFAYDLPEGVTAYKVTQVTTLGDAKLEALTDTIPAQTPVLLKSTAAGDVTLTLAISDAKAPTDNLLVGPDYLINTYDIQVTELISLFQLSKALLGETFYNNHIAQYEHLRLKNAGTVNNKYFWGLSSKDVEKCTYNNGKDCVVRSLATGDKGLGFYDNWTVNTNSAFLVSEHFNPIRLDLRGDVNRDGVISISDVTAIIDILLVGPENQIYAEPTQMYPRGLDYEAADFNESGEISIKDVTELIDYLLANDLNN